MLRYFAFVLVFSLAFASCEEEELLPDLNAVEAPDGLGLNFAIADDNSGEVTITPSGMGVTAFTVFFGDGTDESVELAVGESVSRVYPEGTFSVALEAMTVSGQVVSTSEDLTVSYQAPENLVVTITTNPGNPLAISVTAAADLATDFAVYFGEEDDEEPTDFSPGETVDYTYSDVGTYDVRVIARAGGASVEETQSITVSDPILLPLNFEGDAGRYNLIGFGRAEAAVEVNPDATGLNTSDGVGRLLKTDGSEVWAGATIEVSRPLDFSISQEVSLKTWSPTAGTPVLLKLENAADDQVFVEVTTNTTVANAWEELTFDFTEMNLDRDYSKVVVFFNFGTAGAGETYYFDDITVGRGGGGGGGGGGTPINLPLAFEEGDYTFNGFGGAGAEVIANPDQTGNSSGNVVSFVKMSGSEVWGGVFTDLDAPLDLSQTQTISMDVWAPSSGVTVMLKVENLADSNVFIEVPVTNTTAGGWETLTFDLSVGDTDIDYQRLVFFFDFGNSGNGEAYYFDNIRFTD